MKKFALICASLFLLLTLALNLNALLPLLGWMNMPAVARAEIAGKDGALTTDIDSITQSADLAITESNNATDANATQISADLAVRKTSASQTVFPGNPVTWTIEVTNNGPSNVASAPVTDNLHVALGNASWTCTATPGSSCGAASGPGSILTTVNLIVGGKANFTLTATVASDYSGDTLPNTVIVTSPAGAIDPNNSNNSATNTINIEPSADLRITNTASPGSVRAGGEVTYTIAVTNGGPRPAQNVAVTDSLPNGLTFVSAMVSAGSCSGAAPITCSIGSLGATPPTNTATVTIKARVNAGFPPGQISNTAAVGSSTSDPNSGNNSAVATITVVPPPGARFSPADIAVRVSGTDACIDAGNVLNVEVKLTNSGSLGQNDNPGSELSVSLPIQLAAVAGSCSVPNGVCTLRASQIDWNGQVNAGQTITLTYRVRVRDNVQAGARFCTDVRVNFDSDNDSQNDSTVTAQSCQQANCRPAPCAGPDCPSVGPGIPLSDIPDATGSDQRPGSILIFPFYTSDPAAPHTRNTRFSVTNIDPARPAYLHMFFVDGSDCAVADNFLCLTPNQTASFLLSELDPGTTGYLIAVAVDSRGCPTNFNFLIGDEYVKLPVATAPGSVYAANLAAESVLAIDPPSCSTSEITATLQLDGEQYSLLGRVLAADNLPSPVDGNSTLLVVNRIGGNLTTTATTISALFGVIYDDTENAFSFSHTQRACQLQIPMGQNFPRTSPRFPEIVRTGRAGWMKLWINTASDEAALVGATINATTSPNGFRGGHNLHKLTLGSAALTIPLIPPSCQ